MLPKIPAITSGIAASLMLGSLLLGCTPPVRSPSPTPGITFSGQLTPYHAPSSTRSVTAVPSNTSTPPPSPTPTPLTHPVKKGEDMGGIAYQYHISVADLMAANPKVDPHTMSVGTLLVIPPPKTQMPTAAAQATGASPSLTPIPVETGPIHCVQDQSRGVWCFMPVENPQDFTLESISAVFTLTGSHGEAPLTQTASLPLDRLPSGETLPLAAYFPPEQAQSLTAPFQASSTLLTALTSPENDGRYLPVQMEHTQVMIAADSLSAEVTVDARLETTSDKARRLWIAVVAYDRQGQVIGVRRWENNSDQVLQNGKTLAVTVHVYSAGGSIDKVSLLAEARP